MKNLKTKQDNTIKKVKTKRQPLVSVIMPVYNAEDYLKEAVRSILKQSYQKFELIIVNDASTDSSAQIIAKFKQKYPDKIKVITLKRNLNGGGDLCANEGLKIARGKYIARMDADDISHSKRLEKQVEFLEQNSTVFLVGSNAHVIDKDGAIIGDKLEPSTPHEIYKSYLTFHPLIHPSCLFRRMVAKNKPFFYQIKYSANNDYYTFFKLICTGFVFVNLEDKLLFYRIHGKNDTFVHMKKKFLNTLLIRMKMIFKYGYKPSLKDIGISLAQSAALFLLPEKQLVMMYLVMKGIVKQENQENIFTLLTSKARFALQTVTS